MNPVLHLPRITAAQLSAHSFEVVREFLPPSAAPLVQQILAEVPCLVVPVKTRKSKHGDHRPGHYDRFSQITVNVCGNSYQFLITLLHELAHAAIHAQHGLRVQPHGREWKRCFADYLRRAWDLFPADLQIPLRRQFPLPSSSSFRDVALQQALRKYDTLDERPMVAELPTGTLFSLDGKRIFRLGPQLRSCFRCNTLEGKVYRVAGSARVQTIYTE
ncbi:MAG: SprT-like domain-containing protein [Pirellulales bacterium]|nr:SprT-like domain-containing protein [Pirellulales bacterium]